MANIVKINTDSLNSDISRIEQTERSIENVKNSINASIRSLNGMWQGPAHDKFEAQFAKDYEAMNEICEMLKDIIGNLKYARKGYDTCEDKVGDIVRSIKV